MGFRLSKSLKMGPVRINMSKSGIGTSIGVKGARVGIGPRGVTTSVGVKGFRYKTTQSFKRSASTKKKSNTSRNEQQKIRQCEVSDEKNVLYECKHIIKRKVKSETKELFSGFNYLFLIVAIITIPTVAFMLAMESENINIVRSWAFEIGGWLSLTVFIIAWVKHNKKVEKVNNIIQAINENAITYNNDDVEVSVDKFQKIVKNVELPKKYQKYLHENIYKDFLNNVISNDEVSDREAEDLKKIKEVLYIDEKSIRQIKLASFNELYLRFLEDDFLEQQEEENLKKYKEVLDIEDEDIKDEMKTIETLREIREVIENDLETVNPRIQLSKKEECYHQTKGRIVKEKVMRTYTVDGVKQKETALVTEREGGIYLTSQRIMVVGEGVYSIKNDRIINIDTDLDRNLICLDVDKKVKPIQITVPDSPVFSAKLNKLIEMED